ncbi:hypothetical protein [uncultured Acinetobacter sp.]|uniref:hypothetical protein n=1 Tax=uncultured Acinetobacter sp. TaxID=165433 RepID=UPI0025FB623F|nr:hypothetical protein [uncultured Acinetobacter sp.]
MAIHVKEIHQKQINAKLGDAELKQAILEYVLRRHDIGNVEYKHRTFLSTNHYSTGSNYEGRCEITIELGESVELDKEAENA